MRRLFKWFLFVMWCPNKLEAAGSRFFTKLTIGGLGKNRRDYAGIFIHVNAREPHPYCLFTYLLSPKKWKNAWTRKHRCNFRLMVVVGMKRGDKTETRCLLAFGWQDMTDLENVQSTWPFKIMVMGWFSDTTLARKWIQLHYLLWTLLCRVPLRVHVS